MAAALVNLGGGLNDGVRDKLDIAGNGYKKLCYARRVCGQLATIRRRNASISLRPTSSADKKPDHEHTPYVIRDIMIASKTIFN